MPLFQYFGWVGSFLLAALLAANGWFPAPTAPTPASDVPLNQMINIRIHTDHKWPGSRCVRHHSFAVGA